MRLTPKRIWYWVVGPLTPQEFVDYYQQAGVTKIDVMVNRFINEKSKAHGIAYTAEEKTELAEMLMAYITEYITEELTRNG